MNKGLFARPQASETLFAQLNIQSAINPRQLSPAPVGSSLVLSQGLIEVGGSCVSLTLAPKKQLSYWKDWSVGAEFS